MEGYNTSFVFENEKYDIVDQFLDNGISRTTTLIIKNGSGTTLELDVGVVLDFYDVEYDVRIVEREFSQCDYGGDYTVIAKFTFVNVDKAYADLNHKADMKCNEKYLENFEEYKEKIKNGN